MSSVDASNQGFRYIQHSRNQTNRVSKTELGQGKSKLDVCCSVRPKPEKCTSARGGGNVCTWLKICTFGQEQDPLVQSYFFCFRHLFSRTPGRYVNLSTDTSRDKLGWDASGLWRISSLITHSACDGSRFPKDTPNRINVDKKDGLRRWWIKFVMWWKIKRKMYYWKW